MTWKTPVATLGLPLLILAGCDETPGPADSGPFTTSVNSMNESDIDAGMLAKDENVSNETGNPWGEFIKRAETVCGADPSGFSVLSATLSLDTSRSDVAGLEEVFTGPVVVYWSSTRGSDAGAVRVDVAGATSVAGTGPVTLEILATRRQLAALHDRLVGGDFHIGIEGSTTRDPADAFSITPVIAMEARAHCD